MQIKTVQPVDMGQDFSFAVGSLTYSGRCYRAGDMIDLEPIVGFSLDSNDLTYHFENFLSPVDSIDIFDVILAPTYPGVSPIWEPGQLRWGRCAADLWIIKNTQPVKRVFES